MNISKLLLEDQKLLARVRVLYPNPHGFIECLEAFNGALDDGATPAQLVEAASGYRFFCQLKYGRNFSINQFCMSAKSFFERKKYLEPWTDRAFDALGHLKTELADPEVDKQKLALAEHIRKVEAEKIAELDRLAAEAPEVSPLAIVRALTEKRGM